MNNWLDEIKWDSDGLVPAIAQETGTGKILMMLCRMPALEKLFNLLKVFFISIRVFSSGIIM